MSSRSTLYPLLAVIAFAWSTGCSRQAAARVDYQMGEKISAGPLVYNVVETAWKTQLGDQFHIRSPKQRFLTITISATNSGGKEVSVPLLTLENDNGQDFLESESGEGVDNWFGLLRNISPADTKQGRLVFDVPLSSYRLRLTDGGEPGMEKYVWVQIPLTIDTDSNGQVSTPGVLAPPK